MRSITRALAVAIGVVIAPESIHAQITAIVGATVIDGTGSAPLRDATILVQGNRITAVGPRASVKVPDGARVIDAANKYITPGFIDVNVHVTGQGFMKELFPLLLYGEKDPFLKYGYALEAAQMALKFGVTTSAIPSARYPRCSLSQGHQPVPRLRGRLHQVRRHHRRALLPGVHRVLAPGATGDRRRGAQTRHQGRRPLVERRRAPAGCRGGRRPHHPHGAHQPGDFREVVQTLRDRKVICGLFTSWSTGPMRKWLEAVSAPADATDTAMVAEVRRQVWPNRQRRAPAAPLSGVFGGQAGGFINVPTWRRNDTKLIRGKCTIAVGTDAGPTPLPEIVGTGPSVPMYVSPDRPFADISNIRKLDLIIKDGHPIEPDSLPTRPFYYRR